MATSDTAESGNPFYRGRRMLVLSVLLALSFLLVAMSVAACVGGIERAQGTPYSSSCYTGLEMRIGDACSYNDINVRIADSGEVIVDGTINGNDISDRVETSIRSWTHAVNSESLEIGQQNNRWKILTLPSPTTFTVESTSRLFCLMNNSMNC